MVISVTGRLFVGVRAALPEVVSCVSRWMVAKWQMGCGVINNMAFKHFSRHCSFCSLTLGKGCRLERKYNNKINEYILNPVNGREKLQAGQSFSCKCSIGERETNAYATYFTTCKLKCLNLNIVPNCRQPSFPLRPPVTRSVWEAFFFYCC